MTTLSNFINQKLTYYRGLDAERARLTGKMAEGVKRLEKSGYAFKGVETIRLNRRFYRYAKMKHNDTYEIAWVNRLGGQTIGYCKNKKIN